MAYTQAMNFSQITQEVQNIRFNSGQTSSIQQWINNRYAALWGQEEWTFRYATVQNLTVTQGSTSLGNLPTDFGIPIGLWRDDGYPVIYMSPREFWNVYAGATDQGAPQFYTVENNTILLGPNPNVSSTTYTSKYERRFTPLVSDSDVPLLPSSCHYHLVIGALALGLQIYQDFTWQFMEERWQEAIQEMKREWLNDQRGEVRQWGRDGVEALPTYQGI